MKTALTVAAIFLLITAPLGIVCAAEVYWDPGESRDIDLSEERELDLKMPDTRTKSFGDMEIYDLRREPEPGELEIIEEEVSEEPVVRPPAPQRPAAPATPEPPRVRQPRTPAPAATQSAPTEPKSTVKRLEKKRGAPAPAAVEQLDKPAGPQLPPGQVEVKPAEPKGKLQWGKDEK